MVKKNVTKAPTRKKPLSKFEQLKLNFGAGSAYRQEYHCEAAINILSDRYKGTIADICKEFVITENQFNEWRRDYPLFNQAIEYGMVVAKVNWQNEPKIFQNEKTELERFDLNMWKYTGKYRFGISEQPKIKVFLDKNLNPVEQYGQLLDGAAMGYYSASEFKQITEAVNIGIRAHEVFNMQGELDELRQTLIDIQQRNAADGFDIPTD